MLNIRKPRQGRRPASLAFVLAFGLMSWSMLLEGSRTKASGAPPPASAVASSVSSLPQALPTPIALYHFDGDFTDSSGNGQDFNAGFLNVSFASGKFGQAAHFDGLGRIIRRSLSGFPTGGPPWTIVMWVKLGPTFGSGNHLIGFSDPSGSWGVFLDTQNRLGIQNDGHGSPVTSSYFSNVQIPDDGNLHHVVVQWGKGGPNYVTFIVDGDTTLSETIYVPHDYWDPRLNSALDFGVSTINSDIDELVLVNGLLSDAQIAQLQDHPYDFRNSPPVAACRNITVSADSSCQASIAAADVNDGSSDPEDGTNVTLSLDSTGPFGLGQHTVMLTATDSQGASSACTSTVTVVDATPPTIICPSNFSVAGNIPGSCAATVNLGTVTATDSCSAVAVGGVRSDGLALADPYPLGTSTITWTATDGANNQASCQQLVTVTNASPVASITSPSSGALFAVGTTVNFTGTFSDNAGGTHSAQWMFDTIPQPGTVNESTSAVSATYTFTSAGVYMVKLTITDGCGGTSTATTVGGLDAMVVIYDPNGGFVTGGGWVNSPAGAYVTNLSLTGKATFGFVSKYLKGATIPTGETEFQFRVANFDFHSTSYDWLVVSGAKGQYKGSGTINGNGNYGFLLTAIDGQINGGGGLDKFRIKIWDKNNGSAIVYDNQTGATDGADPTTVIGGGSIVIHK